MYRSAEWATHSLSVQLSQSVHFVQSSGRKRALCETTQTLYNRLNTNNGRLRPFESKLARLEPNSRIALDGVLPRSRWDLRQQARVAGTARCHHRLHMPMRTLLHSTAQSALFASILSILLVETLGSLQEGPLDTIQNILLCQAAVIRNRTVDP